jgi:hypothetical protein
MHILIINTLFTAIYICTAYYSAVVTGTLYILSLLSLKNELNYEYVSPYKASLVFREEKETLSTTDSRGHHS